MKRLLLTSTHEGSDTVEKESAAVHGQESSSRASLLTIGLEGHLELGSFRQNAILVAALQV
jgi:hypothetical protein